jgi:hypothetical protein
MPGIAPDCQSVFAAKQVLYAGPASESGAAFAFYLLVRPASLEVRAQSKVYLLAQPASPFAHVWNRVCLPNDRRHELILRHSPVVSPSVSAQQVSYYSIIYRGHDSTH